MSITEAGFLVLPKYIEKLVRDKIVLYDNQPDGFIIYGTKNEGGLNQNLTKIKRFIEKHNGFYELVSKEKNEAIIIVSGSVGLVFEKLVNEQELKINGKQYELFSQIN
ncbi:hypothetical protein [Carnobacterium maltaromaticum]|uniref:hypothetical protein n=1 Tax=Carnobacterium maltaromaticum TaxID=2751 RepID=UPI0012F74028|nr:hypothetical protein [Carnobacterium maltaromaticum]